MLHDSQKNPNLTAQTQQLRQKIEALETTVAFLDDTVEQLNHVIAQQDKRLADNERLLKRLCLKLFFEGDESSIEPFDLLADRPPHY